MIKVLKNVRIVGHAVVRDSLGMLRDKRTGIDDFRRHSDRVCRELFAEAIRDLDMQERLIETPLAQAKVETMNGGVVVVPILRSGIAMLFGALDALPKSRVGFVGLARDEETAVAKEYYWKMPEITTETTVIITDPMLATGGSLWHVLDRFRSIPVKSLKVVCVVAAPEGLDRITKDFPQVEIFTAAVDERLNSKAYIVPGLGDYGDRYFGTQPGL